jgi:hypothetical protein
VHCSLRPAFITVARAAAIEGTDVGPRSGSGWRGLYVERGVVLSLRGVANPPGVPPERLRGRVDRPPAEDGAERGVRGECKPGLKLREAEPAEVGEARSAEGDGGT